MTREKWIYASLASLVGICFWFHLDALAYIVGAAMTAYAARNTFRSAD